MLFCCKNNKQQTEKKIAKIGSKINCVETKREHYILHQHWHSWKNDCLFQVVLTSLLSLYSSVYNCYSLISNSTLITLSCVQNRIIRSETCSWTIIFCFVDTLVVIIFLTIWKYFSKTNLVPVASLTVRSNKNDFEESHISPYTC